MRVSANHDAAPGGSAPRYTDVVGVIVTSERDAVTVRRRDGSLVQIAGDDVVAVRLLADAGPPRRTDPEQLQRMAARGWPAPVTEPLGQWLLRAADGFTGRANSVSVHGDPGVSLPAALRRVADFYARHGLPARAQVVRHTTWDDAFTAAGWQPAGGLGRGAPHAGAVVLTATLRDALARRPRPEPVPVHGEPTLPWLRRYGRTAALWTAGADLSTARAVLGAQQAREDGSIDAIGFARLDAAPGEPAAAVGRMVVTGAWAGMACVEVDPGARRSGLGRRVVHTLMAWAVERGARWCYLQTLPDNSAALSLYASYGFAEHSSYRYLSPPAQDSAGVPRRSHRCRRLLAGP
jgi:ribosomal protein S18 acetylase RimI-like enzyme